MKQFLLRLFFLLRLPHLLLALSRPGVRILMYHGVSATPDPDAPTGGRHKHIHRDLFAAHMAWLAGNMQVLSIDDLVVRLENGAELPRRGVVVTLDDGYRNNHEQALALLRQWRIPAVVYVSTCMVEGRALWTDRLDAALSMLALEGQGRDLRNQCKRLAGEAREQLIRQTTSRAGFDLDDLAPAERPADTQGLDPWMLAEMKASGVSVGSHTVNHEILSRCCDELLARELEHSGRLLRSWSGAAVEHFAYPNGGRDDLDARTEAAVARAGYRSSLSTMRGTVRQGMPPWTLPRLPVDGGTSVAALAADLSGVRPALLRLKRMLNSGWHRRSS